MPATALACLALVALSVPATLSRPAARQAVLLRLDGILAGLGLGIDEIRLNGHRHTLDGALFAALGEGRELSVPMLDAVAARRRVEALPWIETARIVRVLPDRIDITVTERKPVAVFLDGTRHVLVDAAGRHLAQVGPAAAAELPRITGDGAPAAVGGLLDALALHPGIAARVAQAHRIGGRRWSLALASGTVVHLPEAGMGAALQHLADIDAKGGLADMPSVVDVRSEGLVAIRSGQAAGAQPARHAGRRS